MKKISAVIVALAMMTGMMISATGCSAIENFFDLDHGGSKKSDRKDRDEERDRTGTIWDRSGSDESEEEQEVNESSEVSESPTPTEPVDIANDLTYPDHIAAQDEIHPSHTPGNISGDAASDLLDEIEADVLQEYIGGNYVDAKILFADPASFGVTIDDVSWGEVSAQVSQEDIDFTNGILERLYTIDPSSLDDQDRIFYDKILYDFEEQAYSLQYSAFNYYSSIFNDLTGPQCEVFFILEVFKFETVQDAEEYIELLVDLDRYYDDICAFEEEKAALGYALSDESYENIAISFDNLASQEDTCFLYDSFEERLDNISGLSAAERDRLIAEHDAAMHDHVFPEFVECAQRMRDLKGSGGSDVGICAYPGGDAYYAMIFRSKTNSSRTIEESVASLDAILTSLIQSYYSDLLSGGTDIYDQYNDHVYSMGDTRANLDYLSTAVSGDFPVLPAHSYDLIDVPEELQENFSPAAFLGYHLDDLNSNLIITNQSNVDSNFGITCAHEGYPGHMFQSVYHRANCEHPYMYIFDSTGYAEGWAVYVENYSFKYFGDTSSILTDLIEIDNQLNVLIMARADIGLHYEGWTKQDVSDYCTELFGMAGAISEEGISSMCDLLLVDPCYAAKYGVGFINTGMTITSVRRAFPDATDLELHTAYLNSMPGTFEQIEANMNRFLSE